MRSSAYLLFYFRGIKNEKTERKRTLRFLLFQLVFAGCGFKFIQSSFCCALQAKFGLFVILFYQVQRAVFTSFVTFAVVVIYTTCECKNSRKRQYYTKKFFHSKSSTKLNKYLCLYYSPYPFICQ